MDKRKKVVPLETYPNEMEAQMMAQILEGNGIPTAVQPMGGGYGALGVTQFIHHRLYVAEEDLERAQEIASADFSQVDPDSPETTGQ